MVKQFLLLTFLFLFNTSLYAMDINETTIIINEATEATEALQDELELIVNEIATPVEKETPEIIESPKREVASLENNLTLPIDELTTTELNSTIVTDSPITPNVPNENNVSIETNTTLDKNITESDCLETNINTRTDNNQTSSFNQSNSNSETNSSMEESSCSDSGDEEGSTMRGRMIFKTRIKPYCKITGEVFAKQYMQEDWDDIFLEKEFKMEVVKACPKMEKRYREEWTPHLYQFVLEYASDSDAIPEC